jgi:beta-keto acid cleavage enzyme
MEKLIITVACDSRTSYPHNPLCPPQEDVPGVAQQYIDAVNAGAAIAHIHGRRTLEETIQPDGRQVSRIHHDDWKRLQDAIVNRVDPIMQFGVASARIEEKIKLMELGPDMMAVCFNAHDEYFQPEPSLPPKRMMAIHPVEELIAYAKAAEEHKVKLECECFTTGAFWHLEFVRKQGYLRENDLYHAVHRLAWRHLDAADRARAAVHGGQPSAELHLERERDESAQAVADLGAGGRARRPRARRLRGQSLHGAGRIRQEQRRAGGAHGGNRALARTRGRHSRRGAQDPGPDPRAVTILDAETQARQFDARRLRRRPRRQ